MSIEIISPTDLRWQQYLDTVPHDFYHLSGYLELEAKWHGAIAEAVLVSDRGETFFLPYLMRDCDDVLSSHEFPVSEVYDTISPYGYPGILVSNPHNLGFIKQAWILIHQSWRDRNICSAFLRLHPLINDLAAHDWSAIDSQAIYHYSDVVVCDLTLSLDELWRQTRSSHRTKINKLRRSGFSVRMAPVEQYLDIFIAIYLETMRRVNARSIYLFDRDYFSNLVRILADRVKICVVEFDDEVVAASMITELSGIVQYHLGGTKTEFLKYSPTTLMFDYIREWSKSRGNNYLNLGGGLGGQHDSLFHFKAGFSKEIKTFTTIRSIVDRELYQYLTTLRAKTLGREAAELRSLTFFPTYRAC